MVDNREHHVRPSGKGHSWAEGRDTGLRALPHHWVIPYHQENGIHPWCLLRWPQHRRWQRESIHFLDSSPCSILHHRATVWETPALFWSIFPSPSHDSAVPGLPTATHHKDTPYTLILNIERWSTPLPPCSSVVPSQLDWSECPRWDIVSI